MLAFRILLVTRLAILLFIQVCNLLRIRTVEDGETANNLRRKPIESVGIASILDASLGEHQGEKPFGHRCRQTWSSQPSGSSWRLRSGQRPRDCFCI
jgi:hypothetical protein